MAKSRSKSKSKPAATPASAAPVAEPAASAPAAQAAPTSGGGKRRIVWLHVLTVLSVTILIGAEVFGAAFAASWALSTLFELGSMGAQVLGVIFVACGIAIMVQFVRSAHKIEPFTARA
jgi:hypothetical protein